MKDYIKEQCLMILKRDDIKNEFKNLFYPLIEVILSKIYPYIYIYE